VRQSAPHPVIKQCHVAIGCKLFVFVMAAPCLGRTMALPLFISREFSMFKKLSVAALTALSLSVFAQAPAAPAAATAAMAATPAVAAAPTCEATAMSKKLAGAAKNAFMKKCERDAGGQAAAAKPDAAKMACEKSAADKKLAGAAKNSFVKKCATDAAAAAK
jgi:hypothetical protein